LFEGCPTNFQYLVLDDVCKIVLTSVSNVASQQVTKWATKDD